MKPIPRPIPYDRSNPDLFLAFSWFVARHCTPPLPGMRTVEENRKQCRAFAKSARSVIARNNENLPV